MNTVRVNICYRPLRIGWAIREGDLDAFRQVVRLSHTMWGGRFNPILVTDREDELRRLVDLFRVDLLWPIGETEDNAKKFLEKFPYLIKPFIFNSPFIGGEKERKRAQLLDIHNMLVYLRDKPEGEALKTRGLRVYTWKSDDPLADVFLIQLGAYPDPKETGIEYLEMLTEAAEATEHQLESEHLSLLKFWTIQISRLCQGTDSNSTMASEMTGITRASLRRCNQSRRPHLFLESSCGERCAMYVIPTTLLDTQPSSRMGKMDSGNGSWSARMGSPCLCVVPPRQYGRAAQTFRGNAIDPLSGVCALMERKECTRAYDAFRRNIRAWGNDKRKRETQSVLRIER